MSLLIDEVCVTSSAQYTLTEERRNYFCHLTKTSDISEAEESISSAAVRGFYTEHFNEYRDQLQRQFWAEVDELLGDQCDVKEEIIEFGKYFEEQFAPLDCFQLSSFVDLQQHPSYASISSTNTTLPAATTKSKDSDVVDLKEILDRYHKEVTGSSAPAAIKVAWIMFNLRSCGQYLKFYGFDYLWLRLLGSITLKAIGIPFPLVLCCERNAEKESLQAKQDEFLCAVNESSSEAPLAQFIQHRISYYYEELDKRCAEALLLREEMNKSNAADVLTENGPMMKHVHTASQRKVSSEEEIDEKFLEELLHKGVVKHRKDQKEDFCFICYDDSCPPTISLLCCGHATHVSCLHRWFETKNVAPGQELCPNCRQHCAEPSLPPQQPQRNEYADLPVIDLFASPRNLDSLSRQYSAPPYSRVVSNGNRFSVYERPSAPYVSDHPSDGTHQNSSLRGGTPMYRIYDPDRSTHLGGGSLLLFRQRDGDHTEGVYGRNHLYYPPVPPRPRPYHPIPIYVPQQLRAVPSTRVSDGHHDEPSSSESIQAVHSSAEIRRDFSEVDGENELNRRRARGTQASRSRGRYAFESSHYGRVNRAHTQDGAGGSEINHHVRRNLNEYENSTRHTRPSSPPISSAVHVTAPRNSDPFAVIVGSTPPLHDYSSSPPAYYVDSINDRQYYAYPDIQNIEIRRDPGRIDEMFQSFRTQPFGAGSAGNGLRGPGASSDLCAMCSNLRARDCFNGMCGRCCASAQLNTWLFEYCPRHHNEQQTDDNDQHLRDFLVAAAAARPDTPDGNRARHALNDLQVAPTGDSTTRVPRPSTCVDRRTDGQAQQSNSTSDNSILANNQHAHGAENGNGSDKCRGCSRQAARRCTNHCCALCCVSRAGENRQTCNWHSIQKRKSGGGSHWAADPSRNNNHDSSSSLL